MDSQHAFRTNPQTEVYARSLYEMAEDQEALDEISQEIEQLEQLLTENHQLRQLVTSRALSRSERRGLIERIFQGRTSDLVYRFLHILNRKDRFSSLPGVSVSFGELVAERRGVVEADLFVAQRLEDEAADHVAQSLGKSLGGKRVVVHQYVDESLIGGVKILIGDRLIDGSVATQLERMRRQLAAAGRQRARKGAEGPRGQGAE